MPNEKPSVSIVIPTYNRSTILPRCLDSLFNQTYPKDKLEILVINDGSKDNTESILRDYEKKAPCRFSWTNQENHGRSYARNEGISKSQGELICFADDDCIAESDWIHYLVNGFNDDSVGAVGGKVVSYQIETPIQEFVEDAHILDQETFFKSNTLITGNAAYRKEILIKIQGFDNFLVACEDLDISLKTQLFGYKLKYSPEAIVYHDHPTTVKGLFSQQYRNGKGYAQLHRKYGKKYNLGLIIGIFGFRILVKLFCFPFNYLHAMISKKPKYCVLMPLFHVVIESAMILGITSETLTGKDYWKDSVHPQIEFFVFMDSKTIPNLWQKVKKSFKKKV